MAQLMRTSNPALNESAFRNERAIAGEAMTLQGTVNKTGLLLILTAATSVWTWRLYFQSDSPAAVAPLVLIGLIGGLIFAFATIFKKTWSPVTRPSTRYLRDWFLDPFRRCSSHVTTASQFRLSA